ncbi:MAG TPA: serine hydrolase [Firmicutes bacterium]|jgi:CubicO group peptidase (beta-lactamase class C family)|nr:serine hydrolase [Bacillota bacterium]
MNIVKLYRLNDLFNAELKKQKLLGASIAVEHHNRRVFQNSYGSDGRDSIYRIFSMSKPITTVAVMILYERGLIDLNDSIAKYLPEFQHMKVCNKQGTVDAKKQITIQSLLNMTSGLVYPGTDTEAEKAMARLYEEIKQKVKMGREFSSAEICNILAQAPLEFEPGERWKYGSSADILGGLVEVVSGQRLSEFFKKELFEPLEMVDTDFKVKESKLTRLATMYMRIDEQGHLEVADKKTMEALTLLTFSPINPIEEPCFETGGAGLYSTLEDYMHFLRMLVNEGVYNGKEILGRKTIAFMRKNQLNQTQRDSIYFDGLAGYGYSNLLRVMVDNTTALSNGSIGEYGWDGLPGNYFLVDPEEGLIVTYLQQISQGPDLTVRRAMRQIIYASL